MESREKKAGNRTEQFFGRPTATARRSMKNCTRCGVEVSDPRWHDYKLVCAGCFVILSAPPPQNCSDCGQPTRRSWSPPPVWCDSCIAILRAKHEAERKESLAAEIAATCALGAHDWRIDHDRRSPGVSGWTEHEWRTCGRCEEKQVRTRHHSEHRVGNDQKEWTESSVSDWSE